MYAGKFAHVFFPERMSWTPKAWSEMVPTRIDVPLKLVDDHTKEIAAFIIMFLRGNNVDEPC